MPSTEPTYTVEFDPELVHQRSMDLLGFCEARRMTEEMAILSLALTLGRLLCPHRPMGEEEEMKYLQDVLNWHGALWPDGGMN